MTNPQNRSALVTAPGQPLEVTAVLFPIADPDSIIVKNHAVALNPLDVAQASKGVFLKSFPACIGSDVAGIVHSVGSQVTRFKPGDRVVGHCWSLLSGRIQDGAFSLYTNVPERNAALIPDSVAFKQAAVLPMAIDTAVCGLFTEDGMGLKVPSSDAVKRNGAVVIVYGATSSVGSMVVQLANAAGCTVVAIAGEKHREMVMRAGAAEAFDYRDDAVVEEVLKAVAGRKCAGVYDAIGSADSHKIVTPIMAKLGSGVLCSTKALPEGLPADVKVKRMFGIGEFSFPVWETVVAKSLQSGQLQCLPEPLVVGQGLESIDEGLKKLAAGASGQKLVLQLP